jgi:hypothetical protein
MIYPDRAVVEVGEQKQFTATAYDADGKKIDTSFVWTVEGDIGIIENGLFTATNVGKGKVIVYAENKTAESLVEVVDTQPPTINHIPVEIVHVNENVRIIANVTDNVAVAKVILYYKKIGGEYTQVNMSGNNSMYSVVIPGEFVTAEVQYYIEAFDTSGNNVTTSIYTVEVFREQVQLHQESCLLFVILLCIGITVVVITIIKKRKRKEPPTLKWVPSKEPKTKVYRYKK